MVSPATVKQVRLPNAARRATINAQREHWTDDRQRV